MQSLDNRTTSVSCGSQESRSGQSLGESAGPPRRISQDAVTEHHEEQITLLPREDPTILEIPRSSSKDAGKPDSNVPAVTLHKSSYIVLMVSIYASLALTAWILTCLLTFRPLTTRHYGYDTRDKNAYRSFYDTKSEKSGEVYRATRTIQAIVAVLTVPLTSAVCSAAAVVFAQSKRKERRLTMRQMMVLADRGWTDPTTIVKLLIGRGKPLSSSMLICALLLNLFGEYTQNPAHAT